MSGELLKPAEAARKLGMPPSTLRVYSTKFVDLLSESASNPPVTSDGRTGHRLYSERDLAVFSRAKELLGRGLTYEQAAEELLTVFPVNRARGRGPNGQSAPLSAVANGAQIEVLIAPMVAGIQNAQKAAEAWQALAEERDRENEELRNQVRSLERRVNLLEDHWNRLMGRVEEEIARQPGLLGRLLGR